MTTAYGSITVSGLTDIADIYFEYSLAVSSANVTNDYPFTQAGELGWTVNGESRKTPPTWQSGYKIWVREVKIKTDVATKFYGNPYPDTAINQTNVDLEALQTKVKKMWSNSTGSYMASGIGNNDVDTATVSTYGFNSRTTTGGISFNYNAIPLTELGTSGLKLYIPIISNNTVTSSNLGVELTTSALKFYDPTYHKAAMVLTGSSLTFNKPNTTTAAAVLDSNGLVLSSGGIKAGTFNNQGGSNRFIYLSTGDYGSSITINGHSASNWRAIIGTKFGVDNEGNLYASNASISGIITVASGSDLSAGLGNYSTTTDMNTAISTATSDMATKTYVSNQGYQTASDVDTAVSTGISNASVSDLSDGSDYAKTDDIPDVSGLAAKSDTVYRTQRIYYRKTSASAPSKNTTWLTTSGTGYGNWSLNIPQLTSGTTKYPYLYTAVQTQTISQYNSGATSNNCSCSNVLLDETTTVIDGGAIIAGSVTANEITVDTLSAITANMGTLTAGTISYGPTGNNNTIYLSANSSKSATIAGELRENLRLAIGRNFGVDLDGVLYATGADIAGAIKADTGYIGGASGWTIATQQISSGSIGTDNSMFLSTKNLAGTVAGKTLTTTAPSWRLTVGSGFGVTNTGILYATGADISGAITASSLTIQEQATIVDDDGLIDNGALPIEDLEGGIKTATESSNDNLKYLMSIYVEDYTSNMIDPTDPDGQAILPLPKLNGEIDERKESSLINRNLVLINDSGISIRGTSAEQTTSLNITSTDMQFTTSSGTPILTIHAEEEETSYIDADMGQFEFVNMQNGECNLTWVARSNGHLTLKEV